MKLLVFFPEIYTDTVQIEKKIFPAIDFLQMKHLLLKEMCLNVMITL